MHLELVARLGVEARLGVDTGDVRVDVHHEHRAAVFPFEGVQVIDVQLAVLGRQGRVEVVGHEDTVLSTGDTAVSEDTVVAPCSSVLRGATTGPLPWDH
jgi:hypothetical protein